MTDLAHDELAVAPVPADGPARMPGRWRSVSVATWRSPMGRVGLLLLVGLVLISVLVPWISDADPTRQRLTLSNQAPSWLGGNGGLLGTDTLGRDLAIRIVYGIRTSVLFGLLTATGAAITGLLVGVLAGYFPRSVGRVAMRVADVQFAVPFLALGVALVAVMGPGLVRIGVVLAIWAWTSFGRTIYATVIQVKESDHITAIRTHGASHVRIISRHIVPNVLGPIIILWSTVSGVLILTESAMSLLGIGIQAPNFSLGSMLADSRTTLRIAWWAAVFPGAVIGLIIVGFNLLGDALRDAISPGRAAAHDPDLD